MKKFLAILVAALLVASMMTAFAADHAISTTSTTHTYQIYQVFTGTKSGDQLVDLKYGQNAKTGTAGESVSATDMAALDAIAKTDFTDNDQGAITALTPYVDLTTTPIAEIGKGKESSASLPEGYYIIKDTDGSLSDPETYTLYMFKVLGEDIVITPKSGTTTVDKTVTETNDTAGTTTAGQKGADYDVGDSIPYSIDINLAENVTDYKTYTVTLTDTLSEGLDAPAQSDITVTLKDSTGADITGFGAPTVTVEGKAITVTYTVSGENGAAIGKAGEKLNNAKINVSYSAVLNANAKSGVEGNPNTYTITYTNNPNGDDTGKTPDQEVKVFTYELKIKKVDGNNQPLEGAGFTLYKVVPEGTTGAKKGSEIATSLGSSIKTSKLDANKYYVAIAMTAGKDGDDVIHTAEKKIDAGDYVLIETTVPSGYNAYEGMNITFTSEINDKGELEGLVATPSDLTIMSSDKGAEGTVQNQSGAQLPETGGIGTTIFYVAGSILVLAAVILLVTKRRMSAGE